MLPQGSLTGENTLILACSGGSNVGQLSNQAAVELTKEGFGKMFCLAGIGGRLAKFVKAASDAPQVVVIDGCSVGCAKAIMDQAQVSVGSYLVLTDLGIEKNKNLDLTQDQITQVKEAVRQKNARPVPPSAMPQCACRCSG
ncbi:MAG: putative zinc-binding protein [Deltaproteobacteria bacterium]|nr:putative zinc-binding protein [Deltaproteobacteria bacterium]